MAYEASEIMFAAALLVNPKPDEYSSVSKMKALMNYLRMKKHLEILPFHQN